MSREHREDIKRLGDPRINLQAAGKMAKPYQVRDVVKALARLEGDDTDE